MPFGSMNIRLGGKPLTLDQVAFARDPILPGQYGILSLSRLGQDFGMYGRWDANCVTVRSRKGELLATATREKKDLGGLYHLWL